MNEFSIFIVYSTREVTEKSTSSVARLCGQLHNYLISNNIRSIVIHPQATDDSDETKNIVKPRSALVQKITRKVLGKRNNNYINDEHFAKRALAIIKAKSSEKSIVVTPNLGVVVNFLPYMQPQFIIYWHHNMIKMNDAPNFLEVIQKPINLVTPSKALYQLTWERFYENVLPFKFFHIEYDIAYEGKVAPEPVKKIAANDGESSITIKFVHAGGSGDNKGLDLMLAIFNNANICNKIPDNINIEFHFVSESDFYSDAGRIKIFAHKKMSKPDLLKFLSNMHVGLMPSLWFENSPLLLHEFLETGLFAIASHAGGIPEVLERFHYQTIAAPNSYYEWENAIVSVLNCSVELLNEYRNNNKQTFHEKFKNNKEESNKKWLQLIEVVKNFS